MSARRDPDAPIPNDDAATPRRRWRRLRRLGAWSLFLVLLLLVVLQTVYLLRQPLLAPMLRRTIATAIGDALGGRAAITSIDGDWLTHLHVRGVELAEAGLLREVRNLELEIRLDPIALARGDLAGLQRLRVHADALQLDLDAPSAPASAPAAPGGGPPDLAPLLALLPDGAEVTVDHLTIRGHDTERAGRATVRVLPGTDPRRRRVAVDAPGVAVAATIGRNGRIAAELAVADAAGVAHLFAPLALLQGGEARAAATLQLAPVFALDAELSVDGLRVRGRAVETLDATGHIDADGLSRLAVDLRAPGARMRSNDVSLSFADALTSLQGAVALDLRDLEPYAELLPPAVLAQLPVRGSLRAHAGGGRLAIDSGFFTAASGTIQLGAGAVRIDGKPTIARDAPLRANVHLTDVASLALPPNLPLQPRDGNAEVRLLDRDGALALEATLDFAIADADGRSGRLHGDLVAALGATPNLRPRLVLDGELLRAAAASMTVHGDVTLHPDHLQVAAFGIDLDDRTDAVALHGTVPLAATDLAGMLAGLDVAATFAQFRLDAIAPWLTPDSPLRHIVGTLDGSARWTAGSADVELRAAATQMPGLAADAPASVAVRLHVRDGALDLEQCAIDTPVGTANATARLPLPTTPNGIDLQALLAGPQDWQQQRATAAVEFAFAGLERLDLGALLGLHLRGDVRGRVRTDGPLGAPLVEAEASFAGLTLGDGGQTFVADLVGDLRIVDRTLHLGTLRGSAFAVPFTLDGDAALATDAIHLRAVRVQDEHGGSVAIEGTVPIPRDGDWRTALRAADLRVNAVTDALDPWLALAGQPATGAKLAAELQWRPMAEPGLQLHATVSIAEFRTGDRSQPVRLELAAIGDARGTRLTSLHAAVGDLAVDGTAGLALAPARLLDADVLQSDAPVTADLVFAPADLEALPAAMLGFAQLGGRLSATAQLTGTLQRPLPTAALELAQGHFVTAGGQRLDDIEARIAITADQLQIDRLEATRGRGPIRIAGGFTAPGPLWRAWREGQLDVTVDGNDVQLHRRAGVKVRADVQLHAHGPLADVAIDGTVALRDGKVVARIPLLDLRHTGARATTAGIAIPGLDLGPGFGGHLDVRITSRDPFQITNNVVDGRFDVALALQGPLAEPALTGTISGPEALVILPGMRLRASTLLVEFRRDNPRVPIVTATLRGRRHGYDVQAVVRGRYDRPQVLLSSNPPLASDELVVLVTTGARPDALRSTSGVSTVLGTYLAQELADWIFGSESTEAKESFLDRFTIESGAEISQAGTESLVVEFRVLDSVYLQGERDVYEDLNMGVVYRLKFR